MDYDRQSHSKFLLMYHMIFVCKYRKKLLMYIGADIKTKIHEISTFSNFSIIEMEVDQDHLHLLVKASQKLSPLMIVRKIKQETTVYAWQTFEAYLSKEFWRERTFWSDGYFVCSIGNVSKDIIEKYIQEQG